MTSAIDTRYTDDDNPELRNPERGMYCGSPPDPSKNSHTIVPKWLYLTSVCGVDLVWNGLNDSDTSEVLKTYAAELEAARAGGYKILFRPRYDKKGTNPNLPADCPSGAKLFHADSMPRQFNHIDAIAAMLGDYRDVIAYIQAGYLGRWGEWNTGANNPVNAPFLYSFSQRSDIIDHVLSAYAARGVKQDVELRRPVFAKEVVRRNPRANVGLHNDCFMRNEDDAGTYTTTFNESPVQFRDYVDAMEWAVEFTANASFGGETCPLIDEDQPNHPLYHTERWRSCRNMIAELPALHMNYLNEQHAELAVEAWEAGGCYNYIRRRLGYRFMVTRVEYTQTVAPGQNFSVTIDVANSGSARLHKPRKAKLALRSGSTKHVYDLSVGETENWAPGTTTRISVTEAPPPPGTYSVRLAIPDPDVPDPDPDPDIPDPYARARIAYAVKLASLRDGVNVFDESTGENDLGVSVTVQ